LKHVEILQECVPSIRRVGIVSDTGWATATTPRQLLADSEALFGVSVRLVNLESPDDIPRLSRIAAAERFDAWFVPDTPFTRVNYRAIADQIRVSGKPWIAGNRQPTALLVYTHERFDPWQRIAEMVSLVLSGVPARDIPFSRPKRFQLVVNQATARSLGIQVPRSILMRAHEVID
jgi:putative ABC transport system substrate-binding protein